MRLPTLFLVEQGNGDAVADIGRVEAIHQAVVGEGDEVGLPPNPSARPEGT